MGSAVTKGRKATIEIDQVYLPKDVTTEPGDYMQQTCEGYKTIRSEADSYYFDMIRKLSTNKTLWEDEEFPTTNSIIRSSDLCTDEWKRPKDIHPEALYVVGDKQRTRLSPSELVDSWLLTAISVACQHNFIDLIVPEQCDIDSPEYCGIFRAFFWRNGSWHQVLVDDRLPTRNDQFIKSIKSDDPRQFWPALLEKAYAKLYGGYQYLQGLLLRDTLEDITGGFCEVFDLTDMDVRVKLEKRISLLGSQSCFLGCSTWAKLPPALSIGLPNAYAIMGAEKVQYRRRKITLVRLCDPSEGGLKWTGPWGRQSPEWDEISEADREKLGIRSIPNDQFFLTIGDLMDNFATLYVCHMSVSSLARETGIHEKMVLNELLVRGEWKGDTAGGSTSNEKTYCKNPQIIFSVDLHGERGIHNKTEVYIALTQVNVARKYYEIAFHLYRLLYMPRRRRDQYFFKRRSPVQPVTYELTRQYYERFILRQGYYLLVPSTKSTEQDGKFFIRIFYHDKNVNNLALR